MPEILYELRDKKVYVAGHRGMVGSAIVRRLASEGCHILTASRAEVDLTRQSEVEDWIQTNRPDVVFLAAAKVGGILANSNYPAEFLYQNLILEANVIHAAHTVGVEKLMFLGSSCIYPKFAEQPISEESLLTGSLEPTNEWYAVAKIAGIKLCNAYRRQYGNDFIAAMPTNLYGPGDNYDLETSHVMAALIRKAHEAKVSGASEITVWGTGTPKREFLHVDDCADACVHLIKTYSSDSHINVGSGKEITILELSKVIAKAVGFLGRTTLDHSKPDGTPRKLMSSDKLRSLGWEAQIKLEDGIENAYRAYLAELS